MEQQKPTVDVTIKLPVLEGYEYTGEYRCPLKGERYLSGLVGPTEALGNFITSQFPILRKTPEWRDATIEDLKRCPVPCRVREWDTERWEGGWDLVGWSCLREHDVRNWTVISERVDYPVVEDCKYFRQCQVQDGGVAE